MITIKWLRPSSVGSFSLSTYIQLLIKIYNWTAPTQSRSLDLNGFLSSIDMFVWVMTDLLREIFPISTEQCLLIVFQSTPHSVRIPTVCSWTGKIIWSECGLDPGCWWGECPERARGHHHMADYSRWGERQWLSDCRTVDISWYSPTGDHQVTTQTTVWPTERISNGGIILYSSVNENLLAGEESFPIFYCVRDRVWGTYGMLNYFCNRQQLWFNWWQKLKYCNI